jgi:predicted metalloprotease with PDZ domain
MIRHRLTIPAPHTHMVEVETTVAVDASSFTLYMPVWTPGSYLVREFARHVERLVVDPPARIAKVRKNAWRVETNGGTTVTVRYAVYCNELTVRTNHVDDTHALLNGAAVFLAVEGQEKSPIELAIDPPPGWRVATSLPGTATGTGTFTCTATDLDTLVDSPIELGVYDENRFEVSGTPHTLVVWPRGAVAPADLERLVTDTRAILETEAKLFGGGFPYEAYLALLHLSQRGRGGLEHARSAALLAPLASFASRDGYLDLLSLVAHEAFHAWNVKRIRPEGLTPYRYQEENYTRLLWWFEGATSYYDWRVLRLAKLATAQEYLDHLASEIAYLDGTYGRLVQSLESASFDAWIKLYRPDENSQNSGVSYYRKGELVCALLDLTMRERSGGRASLDAVLKHLWEEHGRRGVPVPEGGMLGIVERVAGVELGDVHEAWVRSAREIDPSPAFAYVGLAVERSARSDAPGCSLGVRLRFEEGRTYVAGVFRERAAHRAGIDPGDELLAIGGRRLDPGGADGVLKAHKAGESVEVLVARDGRILARSLVLDPARQERVKLVPRPEATDAQRAAFVAWLGEDAKTGS